MPIRIDSSAGFRLFSACFPPVFRRLFFSTYFPPPVLRHTSCGVRLHNVLRKRTPASDRPGQTTHDPSNPPQILHNISVPRSIHKSLRRLRRGKLFSEFSFISNITLHFNYLYPPPFCIPLAALSNAETFCMQTLSVTIPSLILPLTQSYS